VLRLAQNSELGAKAGGLVARLILWLFDLCPVVDRLSRYPPNCTVTT